MDVTASQQKILDDNHTKCLAIRPKVSFIIGKIFFFVKIGIGAELVLGPFTEQAGVVRLSDVGLYPLGPTWTYTVKSTEY